ncbi:MAG: hypothetical protein K6G91_13255 [Kiritimatiellae bacterium]|nr:hypothetical protein [Kiritimatiellia bacterium]
MRKNRVVEQNRCYHLVSRLAHRAFFLDDEEKDRAVALMRRVDAGVKASMSYCINRTVSISSDPFDLYDVGNNAGIGDSNLLDSSAFAGIGYQRRGQATGETSLTLNSTPPNSMLSESFFKAAGAEVIAVFYGGTKAAR